MCNLPSVSPFLASDARRRVRTELAEPLATLDYDLRASGGGPVVGVVCVVARHDVELGDLEVNRDVLVKVQSG